MRTIDSHKVNGCNEQLRIEVVDDPGSGGANHRYDITGFDTESNPSNCRDGYKISFSRSPIVFQNGPIGPNDKPNGITNEALLAILIDRLQCFQRGPYACNGNAMALTLLEEAQHWLHGRTRDRLARGVEGTHIV